MADAHAHESSLLQLIRLACRMKSLLARIAADGKVADIYRRQAAQCLTVADDTADWIYTGLGEPPTTWPATKVDILRRRASSPTPLRPRLRPESLISPAMSEAQRRRWSGHNQARRDAVESHLLSKGACTVQEIALGTRLPLHTVYQIIKRMDLVPIGSRPVRYAAPQRAAS